MPSFLEQAAIDAEKTFYGGEFGEPVTISNGTVSATVSGIFDMTHVEVDLDTGAPVMSTKPRVSLWAPNVPWALKAGQGVSARGGSYVIRDVEQQGDMAEDGASSGSVILILNTAK
jgi:hypothetical protein